ncbi:hypothetical protein HOY82DRAFT_126709 [Tuber indicum]|nr:hypothetical protein HOY82DRAFT_126709 [Tuber indicum]
MLVYRERPHMCSDITSFAAALALFLWTRARLRKNNLNGFLLSAGGLKRLVASQVLPRCPGSTGVGRLMLEGSDSDSWRSSLFLGFDRGLNPRLFSSLLICPSKVFVLGTIPYSNARVPYRNGEHLNSPAQYCRESAKRHCKLPPFFWQQQLPSVVRLCFPSLEISPVLPPLCHQEKTGEMS